MAKIKIEEIKEGMHVLINGKKCKVTGFEKSNVGKFGKVKCRIEAVDEKNETIIVIRLSDDTIEVL